MAIQVCHSCSQVLEPVAFDNDECMNPCQTITKSLMPWPFGNIIFLERSLQDPRLIDPHRQFKQMEGTWIQIAGGEPHAEPNMMLGGLPYSRLHPFTRMSK
jgi:hypothetical protein